MRWLKNVLLVILLAAIVIASFWISFLLGKQMLMPVKKLSLRDDDPLRRQTEKINLLQRQMTFEVVTEGDEGKEFSSAVKPEPEIDIEIEASEPVKKEIPAAVKKKVSPKTTTSAKNTSAYNYSVQVGAFSSYANAQALKKKLNDSGFACRALKSGSLWKVKAGPYASYNAALSASNHLQAEGFEAIIIRREN